MDAFYASGRAEVSAVLEALPDDTGRHRAMDWGSGTGRLSFALAESFAQVTCVDVSDTMLATLTERAAARGLQGLRAVRVDRLSPAADHDLVLSLLVLQHLPSRAAVLETLDTMVRCLRVGGRLVVEIPDAALNVRARLQPRYRVYRLLRLAGVSPGLLHDRGLSGISMVTVEQATVRATLERSGATVEQAAEIRQPDSHRYVRYVARRTR